ncbi:MAG TPA: DUF3800 domain-containing protein [Rickettsia endosymbiont of Pyrocoelia pectoralis]|nr:DUF3800 domain-containing protein [Rickettsia endosymbiont of Pyrocoelia pectoralis]
MKRLQYKVIACVIHKNDHLHNYGAAALDPYMLSLDILLERFGFDIPYNKQGLIIAEKRNNTLDNQLKIAWENLKVQGTRYLRAKKIRQCFKDLELRDKKDNIAGLQLADLVVTPIGRYILGKQIKEDFQIIRQKFRKNDKAIYEGYGLIVLPKNQ